MYTTRRSANRLSGYRQFLICLLIILPVAAGNAQPQREARVDADSAERASISLCRHVRDSVDGVGGDIKHQRIHLVIAFSTGHFAKDPLAADAARRMAAGLVSHLLIQGDQLSAYAWEIHVWPHLRDQQNTRILDSEDERRKERLSRLWPLSPASGSSGGHDTERAIVEITQGLRGDSSSVVVLITNTAASIGTRTQRVIGQNDPDYLDTLSTWHREPQISKSGASITLPFDIINPDGSRLHRSLDAVVLVPRDFSAPVIAGRVRPDDARVSAPPTHTTGTFPWWILILALVGIAAVIAWKKDVFSWLFPQRGPLILEVYGRRFPVETVRDQEEICHLAGNGYESSGASVFVTNKDGLPPARLARFMKNRNTIDIRGDKFSLYSVDGKPFTGTYRMLPGMKCRLCFRGEYSPGPAYPSRQVTAEVDASLDRETPGKG